MLEKQILFTAKVPIVSEKLGRSGARAVSVRWLFPLYALIAVVIVTQLQPDNPIFWLGLVVLFFEIVVEIVRMIRG